MFEPINNMDLSFNLNLSGLVTPHLTWASTLPIHWLPIFFRTLAFMVAAPIVFLSVLDVVAYLIARTLGAGAHHHPPHYGSDTPPYAAPIPLPSTLPGTSAPPISLSLSADTKLIDRRNLSASNSAPTITISPPQGGIEATSLESALHSIQLATPPSSSTSSSPSSSSTSPGDDGRLSPDSPRIFPQMHFTSASEGNFALAGEGLFSPPESRSNSPPVERWMARKRGASLTGSDVSSSDASSSVSGAEGARATGLPTPNASLRKRNPGLTFTPMNARS